MDKSAALKLHAAPASGRTRSQGRTSGDFASAARAPGQARVAEARPRSEEVVALVYRQMHALCGGRAARELDDLVQVAAEQVLRALPSFEGRSQLSTWTYRICYLTWLKHERWYRRWLRRFALTRDGELPEAPAALPSDDDYEQAERAARLHAAIAQLSPKRRAVVVLHDLEGHDVAETAAIVKTNELTVRSRLRDGRKALAQLLASDPYFGDEACEESST